MAGLPQDCRAGPNPQLVPPGEGPESAAYDTLRAVVAGGQGSILVIDNGSRSTVNSFGGIVGTTSKHYGVAGCVSDGAMRDINEYKALDFPCYASGPALTSIRTRSSSAGYGIEVTFAGLAVRPGDLVFGDENGVLIVPRDRIEAVLETAELVERHRRADHLCHPRAVRIRSRPTKWCAMTRCSPRHEFVEAWHSETVSLYLPRYCTN